MQRQCHETQCGQRENPKADDHAIDGDLDDAVRDPQKNIGPGDRCVDACALLHQREAQRDGIEDRRLFKQVIIIVRRPLRLGFDPRLEIGTAAADQIAGINPGACVDAPSFAR